VLSVHLGDPLQERWCDCAPDDPGALYRSAACDRSWSDDQSIGGCLALALRQDVVNPARDIDVR